MDRVGWRLYISVPQHHSRQHLDMHLGDMPMSGHEWRRDLKLPRLYSTNLERKHYAFQSISLGREQRFRHGGECCERERG